MLSDNNIFSSFLYESPARVDGRGVPENARGATVTTANEEISAKLEEFLAEEELSCSTKSETGKTRGQYQGSLLSGSLSMALCYTQRILREPPPTPQPRILCLQGSRDAPHHYIAFMNSIFSAQRSQVPVDACMVGARDSGFLQQASDITGGVYLKPAKPEGLLQYLLMVFVADLHSRKFLKLPKASGVDFRASCFCHKKTIDVGYVCSVCLSIFCTSGKVCSTCGASFSARRVGAPGQQKRKVME